MATRKLTAKTVEAAKAEATPYELRDAYQRGLILRVQPQPSNVKTWYLEWKRGRRLKLGRADTMTLESARQSALSLLAELEKNGEPRIDSEERPATLGEFIEGRYSAHAKAHQRDATANLANIEVQFSHLWNRPLQDVTVWLIERWRQDKKRSGMAPKTINRHLSRLKAALNNAVEWGLLTSNVIAGVKPMKTDRRGVVRSLAPDEQARLRTALRQRDAEMIRARCRANAWREERGYKLMPVPDDFGDYLTPMILLSLNTGLRRGELVTLEWSKIDFKKRTLTVVGFYSKNLQTRVVPLNDEAIDVLKRWRSQKKQEGRVFPGTPSTAWRKLLARARVENFRWHDMRHTFATRLVTSGVDLPTVRDLLGHHDISMTSIYTNPSPEHHHAAVRRLDQT